MEVQSAAESCSKAPQAGSDGGRLLCQSTDSNQQHWRGEGDGKERGRNGRDGVREGDIRCEKTRKGRSA